MTLKSDDGDVQFWPRGTDSSTDFQSGWWFGTFVISHNMLGIILPIDFHIYQDGYCTTNQPIAGLFFFTEIHNTKCQPRIDKPWLINCGGSPK
jgi:hypothetical protein